MRMKYYLTEDAIEILLHTGDIDAPILDEIIDKEREKNS